MEIRDIPLGLLREAPWNPNQADARMLARLGASLGRFGVVVPLVVRRLEDAFEVLSGNMRLRVLQTQGVDTAPCLEVPATDAQARLLAEALNRLHGDPGADLAKRAALVERLLTELPAPAEVLAILPDTRDTLQGWATLGQSAAGTLEQQLARVAAAEAACQTDRLHVTSFSLTAVQKEAVERAVALALSAATEGEAPNPRGRALAALCDAWATGRGYRPTAPPPRRRVV